ncbi:cupin domain-containing protein, partial [Thioclava sp. BHET1]
ELLFEAGGALVSEPHGPGCREHVTVIEGDIAVMSGGAREALGPGDTARYPADRKHEIRAGQVPARALLIVQNS